MNVVKVHIQRVGCEKDTRDSKRLSQMKHWENMYVCEKKIKASFLFSLKPDFKIKF